MAYACPVCAFPQADATHLAHHLAFSAMTGDDDHEAWLDEHAPEWADCGPEELAERVLPHAEELEDGATADDLGSAHDHGEPPAATGGADTTVEPTDLAGESGRFEDDDVEDVLREARELTRQRRGEDAVSGAAGAAEDDDGAGEGGDGADGDGAGNGEDDARTETTADSETE